MLYYMNSYAYMDIKFILIIYVKETFERFISSTLPCLQRFLKKIFISVNVIMRSDTIRVQLYI